ASGTRSDRPMIDPSFAALLSDFVAETLPMAQAVGEHLLALERRWQAGQHDAERFALVKSDLHTIKGNSAMMGLEPVQAVAHALEDVCAFVAGDPERGRASAALLLQGSDLLAALNRAAAEGEVDPARAVRYAGRVATRLGTVAVPAPPAEP